MLCGIVRNAFSRAPGLRNRYWDLAMTEGDAAFAEIVGRQFQRYFVAGQNANAVSPQASGKVGQDDALMFELHTK